MSVTTEKIDASSADNLPVIEIPSRRSMMYIKKNKSPVKHC